MAEELIPGFRDPAQPIVAPEPTPTFDETVGAAFELENDVVNTAELLTRPEFEFDENFLLFDAFEKGPLKSQEDKLKLAPAQSQAEFDFITGKIQQERKAREILTASGGGGIAASIAAAVISPTTLVPLGVAGTFVKGAYKGAALTAVAVGTQEIPLALSQELRTKEEIFTGIAAGAILGGVMGGAIGSMNKRALRKSQYDMVVPSDGPPISLTPVHGTQGHVDVVEPVTGTYKFRDETGQMQEFSPKKLLVVTEDSIPILTKSIKGKITQAKLEEFARKEGYDSIHVDDFENLIEAKVLELDGTVKQIVDEVGNTTDELVAKVPDAFSKKDTPKPFLTVIKDDVIKPIADDIPDAPYPSFGTGIRNTSEELELQVGGPIVGAGAQSAIAPSAGGVKKTLPGTQLLSQQLLKISPVARTIDQIVSPTGRWAMSQISNAGLRSEKNIFGVPTALGGNVEHLMKQWDAPVAQALENLHVNYANYVYDGKIPLFSTGLRATIKGALNNGKLSLDEFLTEVSKAMRNSDKAEGPAAAYIERTATDFRDRVFNPMLKVAKDVGIFPEHLQDIFDASFLNRVYNTREIAARRDEFVKLLADHYEEVLTTQAGRAIDGIKRESEDLDFFVKDTALAKEEAESLLEQFKNELKAVTDDVPDEIASVEDEIVHLNELAKVAPDRSTVRDLKDRVKELRKTESLIKVRGTRAGLRKRIKNLSRNRAVLAEKQQKKFDTIERIETSTINSIGRAVRRGQKLIPKLERLSDTQLSGEVSRIKNLFASALGTFDKGETALAKISAQEIGGDFGKLINAEILQDARITRLNDIVEGLTLAEGRVVDREGLRQVLTDGLDEQIGKIADINARRAVRADKLAKLAEKLDPATVGKQIESKQLKLASRVERSTERLKNKGGDDIDLLEGTFNFRDAAIKNAKETTDIILKEPQRLSMVDVVQAKRGTELARTLALPSKIISDAGFLEDDALLLMKKYVRTLAPDIELTKKFGSPNAELQLEQIADERLANAERLRAKGGPNAQKLIDQSNAVFNQVIEDIDVVISRARHTRGIPDNVYSTSARLAKVASDANVLRFMGTVLPSSIPDVGRHVQKFGLGRVFGDGLVPLMSNFKTLKLVGRELKLAGGALDVIMHTRANVIFDVFDEVQGASKFERALHYGSSKMGIVALFDYWNVMQKQFAGVLTNAKLIDSIDLVVNGNGTKTELDEATDFLAFSGMNPEMTHRIWDEITSVEGGGKVNGIWLPNTEKWKNKDLVDAYRAALVGEVDNVIVTPGFERPNIVDKSMGHKLLFQFKSFALSSTTKTTIAGLQQRDANHLIGSAVSLALGALSYYLWAMGIGGRAQKEMENASPEKILDEAWSRAGLDGIVGLGRNIASKIPAITQEGSPLSPFVPQPFSARTGGSSDLFTTLLGPSFDLGADISSIITGLHEPTATTVHKMRTVTPLQNHFLGRRIYTKAEEKILETFGIPDRRR